MSAWHQAVQVTAAASAVNMKKRLFASATDDRGISRQLGIGSPAERRPEGMRVNTNACL